MAWSRQQLSHARQEVQRRKTLTNTDRLLDFMKPLSLFVASLLFTVGGFIMVRESSSQLGRVEGITVVCIFMLSMLVTLAASCVRYLDWYRGCQRKAN